MRPVTPNPAPDFRRTLRMVAFFFGAYPARSAMMVVFMLLAGLAEGVGITLFLPLLGLVASDAAQAQDGLGRTMVGLLGAVGLPLRFEVLLLVLVATLSAKALFLWLAMSQVGFTVARVMTDLRLKLLGAVLRAKWSYYIQEPSGLFTNAVGIEAQKAAAAYRCAATAFSLLVQTVIYLSIAFLVFWRAAVLAVLAGAFMLGVVYRLMGMSRCAGRAQNAGIKQLLAGLVDVLQGIKPVKAMGRENHVLSLLSRHAHDLDVAQRRQVMASETLKAVQEPIVVAFLALGFLAAFVWMQTPFATMALLGFLFLRVLNQMNAFAFHYQAMISHEADFWSLRARIDTAEEHRETSQSRAAAADLKEGIVFDDVTFAYPDKLILDAAAFTIPARSFVAIEGVSGAGKTTIADLVIGLLSPRRGSVRVDGIPLETLDVRAWRERIGYVPQEMFLFHDTIFQNVSLGDPGITPAKAEEALRAAGVWETVANLPGGLDTVVGERGLKLSGGQRQRVAIARALARKPALLIIDEVTTALDPATEQGLCETLEKLKGTITILSISHQPALSRIADLRLVLADGQVTRRGDRSSTGPTPRT